MTKRMVDRWIPAGARVAEIGVGVGHYSELDIKMAARAFSVPNVVWMARRGLLRSIDVTGQW